MKKFVSMQTINRVFDDMEQVDYVTVEEVTDSTVCIHVHLNKLTVPKKGSKEFSDFMDRCIVLGKILDRKIQFVLVKSRVPKFLADAVTRPLKRLT